MYEKIQYHIDDPDYYIKNLFASKKYYWVSKFIDKKNSNLVLTSRKNTILHKACQFNLIELIEKLVENDVIVDSKNCSNWTPFMMAVYHGKITIASYLLKHGADFEAKTINGFNILYIACKGINKNSIEFVLHEIFKRKLEIKEYISHKKDFLYHFVYQHNPRLFISHRRRTQHELNRQQLHCLRYVFKLKHFSEILNHNGHKLLMICLKWLNIFHIRRENNINQEIHYGNATSDTYNDNMININVFKLRRIFEYYKLHDILGPSICDIMSEENFPDARSPPDHILNILNNQNRTQNIRLKCCIEYHKVINVMLKNKLYINLPFEIIRNISEYTFENKVHLFHNDYKNLTN